MKIHWYLKTLGPPYEDEDGDWVQDWTPRRIWWWWLKAKIRRGKHKIHINKLS